MADLKTLDKQAFDKFISENKVVLVDFYGLPCQLLSAKVDFYNSVTY